MKEHPLYPKVRDFLSCKGSWKNSLKDRCWNYAHWIDDHGQVSNAACHMGFNDKKRTIAGNVITVKSDQMDRVARAALDFIMSDISPWRIITQDKNSVEIVESEQTGWISGIIIGPDVFNSIQFNFIKNFFIATRSIAERCDHWNVFDHLVRREIDPRDALFLSRLINPTNHLGEAVISGRKLDAPALNDLTENVTSSSTEHNGGHWPLTNPIDWNRYWYGNVTKSDSKMAYSTINGYFQTDKKYKEFNLSEVKKTEKQARFSSYAEYNLGDVLEYFYKWKERNGFPKG